MAIPSDSSFWRENSFTFNDNSGAQYTAKVDLKQSRFTVTNSNNQSLTFTLRVDGLRVENLDTLDPNNHKIVAITGLFQSIIRNQTVADSLISPFYGNPSHYVSSISYWKSGQEDRVSIKMDHKERQVFSIDLNNPHAPLKKIPTTTFEKTTAAIADFWSKLWKKDPEATISLDPSHQDVEEEDDDDDSSKSGSRSPSIASLEDVDSVHNRRSISTDSSEIGPRVEELSDDGRANIADID